MKLNEVKEKLAQTQTVYKEALSQIKTGAASPAMVEDIMVEAYEGSKLTLKELATISINSPSLIIVTPWDKSVVPKIEKAIRESGAGLNPAADDDNIKVPVPELNEEQRQNYVKLAKEKLEEAKIAVRNIRQNAFKAIDEREDNGVISEDERNSERTQVDSEMKKANENLEQMFADKQKQLMTV
jgi:ribosome recycling factor